MPELQIRRDRIKTIDIKDGDEVVATARFNPHDAGKYREFVEAQMKLAKDSREIDALTKQLEELSGDQSEDEMYEAGEYDKLTAIYDHELKMCDATDKVYGTIKELTDSIFGNGIYDALTLGYHDDGMVQPLFDEAKPFFEEAAKERGEKVEAAKLNREQRRARK